MKFLLFLLLSLSIALTAIPNEFKFEIQEGKYTLSYVRYIMLVLFNSIF